ncbi:hypothetical protein ACIQCG_01205 [Streptomyces noursei]|uniref:hypothetical protein n=1 Tax=Streptomyces noursei TaxID=1971 RepID=UPI00382C9AB1
MSSEINPVPPKALTDQHSPERQAEDSQRIYGEAFTAIQREVLAVRPDATGFQPLVDPHTTATFGCVFRHRYGATARYGWALADGTADYETNHQSRWAAETGAHQAHNTKSLGALPYHGPGYWNGAAALCGYDDHRAPLRHDGLLANHERNVGVIWPCPGGLLTPRAKREEPTRQDTAQTVYGAPRPNCLATSARPGDHVLIDGTELAVASCEPHSSRHHVWVSFETGSGPGLYAVDDQLTYTRRVRKTDVRCTGCGVYVVAESDEATQGAPTSRVCGLCDLRAATASPDAG